MALDGICTKDARPCVFALAKLENSVHLTTGRCIQSQTWTSTVGGVRRWWRRLKMYVDFTPRLSCAFLPGAMP